jgi:hypothetical protein
MRRLVAGLILIALASCTNASATKEPRTTPTPRAKATYPSARAKNIVDGLVVDHLATMLRLCHSIDRDGRRAAFRIFDRDYYHRHNPVAPPALEVFDEVFFRCKKGWLS